MAAAIGNKYAVGNSGGKNNLKFKSLEELQTKIDAYFDSCYEIDENGKKIQIEPFTITGLALALDTSREVLMDIQNRVSEGYSEEFSDAVIRAKLRCHNYAEKQLFTAKSAQGAIFALKNYGWKDTSNIEVTGADGGPLMLNQVHALTDADLRQLEEIMSRSQIQGEIMDIEPKE